MTTSDPLDELLERLSSESDQRPKSRRTRKVRTAVEVLEDDASTGTVPVLDGVEDPEASTKAPGPTLFSERHPAAYELSRIVLPRAPVLLIIIPLCALMAMNLVRGDYLFFIRWYEKSIVFPWLVRATLEKGYIDAWWAVWGPFTVLVLATIAFALVAFYLSAWRIMFKDYLRYSEGVETKEGRCYWLEGAGMWFALWDAAYGRHYHRKRGLPYEPKRARVTAYIRDRAWPPINPASPTKKMLKVHLAPSETVEKRGWFEVVANERKYRRIVGIREFETHDDAYTSAPLPTEWGRALFKSRIGELVKETQTLTKANVGVRLDKMKAGTIILDEELKEMMLHERRKKDTGA